MCNQAVQVVVVSDEQLPTVWAAARGRDGERVLLVRESAQPAQVAEGYASALLECPVREALGLALIA